MVAFHGGVSWWRFMVAFRGGVSWFHGCSIDNMSRVRMHGRCDQACWCVEDVIRRVGAWKM